MSKNIKISTFEKASKSSHFRSDKQRQISLNLSHTCRNRKRLINLINFATLYVVRRQDCREYSMYSRNVFLYSRNVFMYSKKCLSIFILIIIHFYANSFHQSSQINSFENQLSIQSTISIFLIQKFVHHLRSNRSTNCSINTFRLSNSYHSLIRRKINCFVINRFVIMKENIKMIFLFEITRMKDFFEY